MKSFTYPFEPMRIASILLLTAATLSVQLNPLFAQTSIRVLTGPTSFTGSSNLEDGIQISGTGTYSSQLAVSTSLRPFMSLEAHTQWGKLGLTAADRKHEMSEWNSVGAGIRFHLPYSNERHLQPWISIGASIVNQSNKTDLTDANGVAYHYWSDGQVYDMAEDAADAQEAATMLSHDYTFETSTQQNRSWGIPIQAGLDLNLTSRLYASASVSMVAGTESSLDPRPGFVDWLTTAQAGIGIRLGKTYAEPRIKYPEELLRLGTDADGDGIEDVKDKCPGTEGGAPVDKHGCPTDMDKDGVPDFKDQEPNSPHRRVNEKGVALSEEQWATVLSPKDSDPRDFIEMFQRIESEDPQNQVTPVDAKGRTQAELRLLKTFGSKKSTIPVKANKENAKPVVKTDNRSIANALAPLLRTKYSVQLAEELYELNMAEVGPMLESGEVVRKFNNSSHLFFVTPSVSDLSTAQAKLAELQSNGFDQAKIIGEINGRIVEMSTANAIQNARNGNTAALNLD